MGCWNETCMISNLPIMAGERIIILLLEQSPYNNGGKSGCYSTDFYHPRTIPLRGVYDDYGGIVLDDKNSLQVKAVLESFTDFEPIPAGENEYHERPVPKLKAWKDLVVALEDGRLLVNTKYGEGEQVAVCSVLIREDVWDSLLTYKEPDDQYMPLNMEILLKDVPKHFQYKKEKLQFIKKINLPEGDLSESILDGMFDTKNMFSMFSRLHFREGARNFGINNIVKFLENKIINEELKLEDPNVVSLIKDLCELFCIQKLMSRLRKTWYPTTGSGSQSSDFNSAKKFHEDMANIASKLSLEYESYF